MFASNLVNRDLAIPKAHGIKWVDGLPQSHQEDQKNSNYELFQWYLYIIHHYILDRRISFPILGYWLSIKTGTGATTY